MLYYIDPENDELSSSQIYFLGLKNKHMKIKKINRRTNKHINIKYAFLDTQTKMFLWLCDYLCMTAQKT